MSDWLPRLLQEGMSNWKQKAGPLKWSHSTYQPLYNSLGKERKGQETPWQKTGVITHVRKHLVLGNMNFYLGVSKPSPLGAQCQGLRTYHEDKPSAGPPQNHHSLLPLFFYSSVLSSLFSSSAPTHPGHLFFPDLQSVTALNKRHPPPTVDGFKDAFLLKPMSTKLVFLRNVFCLW